MYIFSVSVSVFCGYPKSNISSSSSYTSTKLFFTASSSNFPKYAFPSPISRYINSNTSAALALLFVTATKYMFSCLTWLKVVEPSVRMGERTCALEMTWMRKTSARRGRQSLRKARKMRFSPFWLKIRIPESMAKTSGGGCSRIKYESEARRPCCAGRYGKLGP